MSFIPPKRSRYIFIISPQKCPLFFLNALFLFNPQASRFTTRYRIPRICYLAPIQKTCVFIRSYSTHLTLQSAARQESITLLCTCIACSGPISFSLSLTLAANDLPLSERLKQACTCSSCVQSRSKGSLRLVSRAKERQRERPRETSLRLRLIGKPETDPGFVPLFSLFLFNIWVVTIRSTSGVTAQMTVRKKEMFVFEH